MGGRYFVLSLVLLVVLVGHLESRAADNSVQPVTGATLEAGNKNRAVIGVLTDAIRASSYFTRERQDRVVNLTVKTLSNLPDVSDDRLKHAKEHVGLYLTSLFNSSPLLSDDLFETLQAHYRVDLNNYAILPPTTDANRKAAKIEAERLPQYLAAFVDARYTDTPPEVRKRIAESAAKAYLEEISGQIGNYFFPQYLYFNGKRLNQNEVDTVLGQNPLLADKAMAYAPIAAFVANKELPPGAAESRIDAFVMSESGMLRHGMSGVVQSLFDVERVYSREGYIPYDQKMGEADKRLSEGLYKAANKRATEQMQRNEHEREVQELLKNTGLSYANGAVMQPPKEGGTPPEWEPSPSAQAPPARLSMRLVFVVAGIVILAAVGVIRSRVKPK